jgi:nitroreductase
MRFNVSEITELIKSRRTITPENFSDRAIHKEVLNNLLNAGIWAPNHGKTQPWRFKIYREQGKEQLKELYTKAYKELTPPHLYQESKATRIASRIDKSSAIVMLNMVRQEDEKIPEIEEIQAVGICAQNIMLMASAYGIGCFWSSPKFIYNKAFNTTIGINEKDHCLGLLFLGYAPGEWPKGQRKPVEYLSEWIED